MKPIPHERGAPELPDAQQVQQFIKALNQATVANRLSQRGLSEAIGIKIGTLTKYLRGAVHPMKVGVGIQSRLAEALGVTLDALVAYYRYGHYMTSVSLDEVESWIRSDAGQQDLPVLMASLQAAGQRWVDEPLTTEVTQAERPKPYTWPLEAVRAARLSDAMRERMGLTDEDLAPLVDRGEYDEELAEAFAVACGFETEDVLEAFAARSVLQ